MRETRVQFSGLDWTKEEQKTRIGHSQRKTRKLVKKMERERQQLERARRQLEQEEFQLFRSFLNRMGDQDRGQMLNDLANARLFCRLMVGLEDDADPSDRLRDFVQRGGPIDNDYFRVLKRELESPRTPEFFRYKPLDRFLQFLFDKKDTMKNYILNSSFSEDGIDPSFLQEICPTAGDDYVEQFLMREGFRSGNLQPQITLGLERLMEILRNNNVYSTPEDGAAHLQHHLQHDEIATSGSDDTDEH